MLYWLTDTHLTMLSIKPKFLMMVIEPPLSLHPLLKDKLSEELPLHIKIHSLGSQQDCHAGKIMKGRNVPATTVKWSILAIILSSRKEGVRGGKREWEESPSYSSCFLVTSSVYEGFCYGRDSQHLHQRTCHQFHWQPEERRWLSNRKQKNKEKNLKLG